MFRINYSGSMVPLKLSTMLLFALIFMIKTDGRVINHGNGTLTYDFKDFPMKPNKSKPDHKNTTEVNTSPFVSVPNYPADTIDQLMKQDGEQFHEFFGNDMKPNKTRDEELKCRAHETTRTYLCDSEIRLKHHQGYVETNTTVLIVNTEEYMQGVNEETCRENGKPPSNDSEVKCVQIFNYRRLVAFDNFTKEFYMTNIKLPSGCHATIIEDSC